MAAGDANERISAAEYIKLAGGKPQARAAKDNGQNRWDGPRVCRDCGGRVLLSKHELCFHVDDVSGVKTVWHIGRDACQ